MLVEANDTTSVRNVIDSIFLQIIVDIGEYWII